MPLVECNCIDFRIHRFIHTHFLGELLKTSIEITCVTKMKDKIIGGAKMWQSRYVR